MRFYIPDQFFHLRRYGIAYRIRDIQNAGTRLLRRVKHLHQIIPVASGSVFGRKFDIGTHGLGISDHLFYLRQNLFPRFIQFGFQVNIAGG